MRSFVRKQVPSELQEVFRLAVVQPVVPGIDKGTSHCNSHRSLLYLQVRQEDSRHRLVLVRLCSCYEEGARDTWQMVAIPRNGINPFVLGQVIATIHYITAYHNQRVDNGFWTFVHESIINSSKDLFDNGHYAESVEAAFLEITVRVKNIIKTQTGEDLDGTAAMQKAFSLNNPIIQVADVSSRTGKDIQQGVMELLTGSIRYIRNPKAHEKIVVEKYDAVRKLHLASLLMNEIDKADVL